MNRGHMGGDGGHSHKTGSFAGPGGPGVGDITINHGLAKGDNISSGAGNRSGPGHDIAGNRSGPGHRGGGGGHSFGTNSFAGPGGPGVGDITINHGLAKGNNISSGARNRSGPGHDIAGNRSGPGHRGGDGGHSHETGSFAGPGGPGVGDITINHGLAKGNTS